MLASRCTDDTGYTQPPLMDLIKIRGTNSQYHNNGIQTWKVASDGKITQWQPRVVVSRSSRWPAR